MVIGVWEEILTLLGLLQRGLVVCIMVLELRILMSLLILVNFFTCPLWGCNILGLVWIIE
ncbi:hypothetical protein REPUB_Repub09cG0078700 [Reevesia pubescens]